MSPSGVRDAPLILDGAVGPDFCRRCVSRAGEAVAYTCRVSLQGESENEDTAGNTALRSGQRLSWWWRTAPAACRQASARR